MVMLSSTLRGRVVKFHSKAVDPNTLLVSGVQGSDSISRPYQFALEMVSKKADIDSAAMLEKPCFLAVKHGVPIKGTDRRGIQTLRYHGVLARFEQAGAVWSAGPGGEKVRWVRYNAVLAPRLWRLSLNVRSRIFRDQTVPQVVESVLKEHDLVADEDYVFKTDAREYPQPEYVVQYQESDLEFVSRLLEREGIFYFFQQGEEGEKLILADSTGAYEPILGASELPYRPVDFGGGEEHRQEQEAWWAEEAVRKLLYRHTPVQKDLILKDFNYRTPSKDLKVESPVVEKGFGTFYEFGDHYKDTEVGGELAEIRAQEIACRERTFIGEGEGRAFTAGATFALSGHYRKDFDQDYLLIEVRHRAEQALDLSGGGGVGVTYGNDFVAIPADQTFRPQRLTPTPMIAGLMNAKIDASGKGEYAEIDEEGRYKVQIPWDLSGAEGGKATRWIRMAQPYAGEDYGMHFPLHKGAEVLLAHVNGDPDRPIIAAAAPNPETRTPVRGTNQTMSMIKTGGGSRIVIQDQMGQRSVKISTPHSGSSIRLGAPISKADQASYRM